MAVTVLKWNDPVSPSPPDLNGLAGSLTNVLDYVMGVLGWATSYTGTNKRIYRPPTGALRGYFRVQDDAPRAAPFNNGCEARLKCSEAASTIDTQVGPYPWATLSLGLFARKSVTADATARPWIAIGDERTLYFFTQTGDYGAGWAGWMAGEYFSTKPTADNYNGLIVCRGVEQVLATPTALTSQEVLPLLTASIAAAVGHFVPRSWSEGAQSSVQVGKHGQGSHSAVGLVGLYPYPNPLDDGLYLHPITLIEPAGLGIPFGRMRGMWHPLHPASSFTHGQEITGTGALAGKTFLVIGPVPDGLGWYVMETSNTWETN